MQSFIWNRGSTTVAVMTALAVVSWFGVRAWADNDSDSGKKSGSISKKKSDSGSTETVKKVDMSAVPPDKKAEKKVRATLPESFKLKHTLHYSIFYDTNEEDVGIFEHAIERTYRSCVRYCVNLGIDVHQPDKKMITFFFNEFDSYRDYSKTLEGAGEATPNQLGFFLPSSNYTYFYNFRNTPSFKQAREQAEQNLAQLGEQMRGTKDPSQRKSIEQNIKKARYTINATKSFGGGVTEETLQHEVAHQVLWNIGFHNPKEFIANPRWFAEGMAQLFEPVTDSKSGNMGVVNKTRCDVYHQLVQANRLFPLREFISTPRAFQRADAGTYAYTQAWALCHYMTRVKRKELKAYVELLNERPKGYKTTPEEEIEAFEKCFGKLDKKWERNWKNWMKNVRP